MGKGSHNPAKKKPDGKKETSVLISLLVAGAAYITVTYLLRETMMSTDYPFFLMGIAVLYTITAAVLSRFMARREAVFLASLATGHCLSILIVAVSGSIQLAEEGMFLLWNVPLIAFSILLVFGPAVALSFILGHFMIVSVDDIPAGVWSQIRKCGHACAGITFVAILVALFTGAMMLEPLAIILIMCLFLGGAASHIFNDSPEERGRRAIKEKEEEGRTRQRQQNSKAEALYGKPYSSLTESQQNAVNIMINNDRNAAGMAAAAINVLQETQSKEKTYTVKQRWDKDINGNPQFEIKEK
jgi:hypothetical protein